MIPLVIEGVNTVYARDQPEYNSLPVKREVRSDGSIQMTSSWELTPNELRLLAAGGSVRLTILGDVHPPVLLTVQPAPPIRGG